MALAGAATPGSLVEETALRAARRRVRLRPLEESGHASLVDLLRRKGDVPGALAAYHRCARVLREELGVDPGPTTQRLLEELLVTDGAAPPTRTTEGNGLVGRRQELAVLTAELDAAASGGLRVVLVHGEAGSGKSRLVLALLERARARGLRTAVGRGHAMAGSVALAPVLGWLGGDLLRVGNLGQHGEQGRGWGRLVFVRELAHHLAATAPGVLVLEDVQWVDQDTLDLVSSLARWETGARLLLVLTARSGALEERTDLGRWLTGLRSQVPARTARPVAPRLRPGRCDDRAGAGRAVPGGHPDRGGGRVRLRPRPREGHRIRAAAVGPAHPGAPAGRGGAGGAARHPPPGRVGHAGRAVLPGKTAGQGGPASPLGGRGRPARVRDRALHRAAEGRGRPDPEPPAGPARDAEELECLHDLAAVLNARHGWTAPSLRATLERAQQIAERLHDDAALTDILTSLWGTDYVGGANAAALAAARAAQTAAVRTGDEARAAIGRFAVGATLLQMGRPKDGLTELEAAIAVDMSAIRLAIGSRPEVHARAWAAHATRFWGTPTRPRTSARRRWSVPGPTRMTARSPSPMPPSPLICSTTCGSWNPSSQSSLLAATVDDPTEARAVLDAAAATARAQEDLWWLPEIERRRALLRPGMQRRAALERACAQALGQGNALLAQRCRRSLAALPTG